ASTTVPSIGYATDIIRGRSRFTSSVMVASRGRRPGSLLRLRDDEVLRVPRVQDPRQHPGLHLARVLGHPVQAPARLVERLARLENLGRLVVDGPLVLAFQNVPE